jgi:hypothetical protein
MELPKQEQDNLKIPIKIQKTNSFDLIFEQAGLSGNFFNPNKNSPPNSFVNKLEHRMKNYYHLLKDNDELN